MRNHVPRSAPPLVGLAALSIIAGACGRGSSAGSLDTTALVRSTPATDADTTATLRGTVVNANTAELVLNTDTNNVTVKLPTPLTVYDRAPSTLAQVKSNTFIGVTTVKQPDGTEQATEIHIFPEELRGLGEGSRMMTPAANGDGKRMTNGNASVSRMTNGDASPSRMSNGTVASATPSTLVVQYAGGSQNVAVPPNTPVTEIKRVARPIVAGENVVVFARKQSDGSLLASRVLIASK